MKTILLGWNDAKFLPKVLKSLYDQTEKVEVIYIDDESTDNSIEIARSFSADVVVRLRRRNRVVSGFPILAENVNAGLKYITTNDEFFMVMPSDVVLEREYVSKMLKHFHDEPKLVIASGKIYNEETVLTAPRGAGRIYRLTFWNKYIKRFPQAFLWESYSVYKALSLNYFTRTFSDVHMYSLRPSRIYKSTYGYAMKELGYRSLYAYYRCALAFLNNPKIGIQMVRAYNTKLNPLDKDLAFWIRQRQKPHLSHLFPNLKRLEVK